MSRTKVLVVGAGAMGAVVGHHFHAAGAEITFLVRPTRKTTLGSSLRLWDHGAALVREFPKFDVVTTPDAGFDVVVVTLDAVALASAEGEKLLVDLGAALRDGDTILVVGTVDVRIRERVFAVTGLPPERVLAGALWMLSYAVSAASFPSTVPARTAKADFGYRTMGSYGFVVAPELPAARRFAELFDASGLSRCLVTSEEELSLGNVSLFPIFVLAELCGWPSDLSANAELWSLAVDAVREIRGLALHGAAGEAAAAATTSDSLLGMWSSFEAAAAPLDWTEFSRYHHGVKVRSSDLRILEACIAEGVREHRAMPATTRLLELAASRPKM